MRQKRSFFNYFTLLKNKMNLFLMHLEGILILNLTPLFQCTLKRTKQPLYFQKKRIRGISSCTFLSQAEQDSLAKRSFIN